MVTVSCKKYWYVKYDLRDSCQIKVYNMQELSENLSMRK